MQKRQTDPKWCLQRNSSDVTYRASQFSWSQIKTTRNNLCLLCAIKCPQSSVTLHPLMCLNAWTAKPCNKSHRSFKQKIIPEGRLGTIRFLHAIVNCLLFSTESTLLPMLQGESSWPSSQGEFTTRGGAWSPSLYSQILTLNTQQKKRFNLRLKCNKICWCFFKTWV